MADGREPPVDLTAPFEGYPWPGNVREVMNLVARRVALGDDAATAAGRVAGLDARTFEHLLDLKLPFSEARARVLAEFEGAYVGRVLAEHGGNVTKAARASGIARRYFQLLKTRSR